MSIGSEITSLLLNQGNIAAQRAQQQGQITAQTIGGITQALSAIPGQIQASKLHEAQIKEIESQVADRNALAAERQRSLAAQTAGEQAIKSSVNPETGMVDHDKAASLWEQAGFPTQANAYRESVQKTAQTAQALQEGQQKIAAGQKQVQQAGTNHLGELAAAGLSKLDTASPMEARDYTMGLVANAASHGLIPPDQAKQMLAQTAQSGPEQLRPIFQQLLDAAPEVKSRLVAEDLKKAETAKNSAQAAKDLAEANAGPKQPAAPAVGSPADYLARYAKEHGVAVSDLTTEQVNTALKQHTDATQKTPVVPNNALDDVKESIRGMKEGTLPPMMPGRATKEYLATMAEAHRQGYNLQEAVTDWNATQKHIATMNGAQQLRLNQAINSLPEMLDKVDALADQWKGGQFPILNKANLVAATNGVYGEKVASVARQLSAQIADVTADLGNVYMGGNSPTDHALGLAAKSLSADWSQKVLKDMTALARNNVQIRSNSIRNTGVAGASSNNQYVPKEPAADKSKDPLGIR